MSAGGIGELNQAILGNEQIQKDWELLRPTLEQTPPTVKTRKEGYLAFSRLLRISNGIGSDEKVRTLWADFLKNGKLLVEDSQQEYDFRNLLELFTKRKPTFKVKWITVDSTADSNTIASTAKTIIALAKESLGPCPPLSFLQEKLKTPIVLTMLGRVDDTPIAVGYGTYVKELELVHINFVARKPNYPGVQILKQLKEHEARVREQFPDVKCVTLKVQVSNLRVEQMYKALGFEYIDLVEAGFEGEDTRFYGKKLTDDAVLPASFAEFDKAYQAARANPVLT